MSGHRAGCAATMSISERGGRAAKRRQPQTLGLVDFVIRSHRSADYFPRATPDRFAASAGALDVPLYAIGDQTAR